MFVVAVQRVQWVKRLFGFSTFRHLFRPDVVCHKTFCGFAFDFSSSTQTHSSSTVLDIVIVPLPFYTRRLALHFIHNSRSFEWHWHGTNRLHFFVISFVVALVLALSCTKFKNVISSFHVRFFWSPCDVFECKWCVT